MKTHIKSQITWIRIVYNLCNHFIICVIIFILWYTQSVFGADEKQQTAAPKNEAADIAKETEPTEKDIKSVDTYAYNSAGKIDPFRSLILGKKEQIKQEEEKRKSEEAKEEYRFKKELEKISQTPLQKFDLASVKVVAIIWGGIGRYALVETPDGKGYTIKKGTYIGKSGGKVKNLTDDTIVVEEKYQDVDKKIKTRTIKLKLKKEE